MNNSILPSGLGTFGELGLPTGVDWLLEGMHSATFWISYYP